RKGHHEPIAKWIGKQGYELMRADGHLLRVDTFQKLDRYKEHDVEVVVADLKAQRLEARAQSKKSGSGSQLLAAPKPSVGGSTLSSQLSEALRLGKGA